LIKEFDVTLRVAVDISTYDMGASGEQIVPTIHSINGVEMSGYLVHAYNVAKEQIFDTLSNDSPEYNEAIEQAKNQVLERYVRDEED
jgi:hypothetical protein